MFDLPVRDINYDVYSRAGFVGKVGKFRPSHIVWSRGISSFIYTVSVKKKPIVFSE